MNEFSIIRWQGIKNCDTKQVSGGYLWIKFNTDAEIRHKKGNVHSITSNNYKAGQQIGFSISNVSNRKEAIQKFINDREITAK